MDWLVGALLDVLTPAHLFVVLLGVTFGLALALLPGFGSPLAMLPTAILFGVLLSGEVPWLLGSGPFGWVGRSIAEAAVTLIVATYCGARFGATASAILYGIPGDIGAITTGRAGNAMVHTGQGAAALRAAVIGAFLATVIAVPVVGLAARPLLALGRSFGPPESAMLGVAGMAAAAGLLSRSLARGALSLGIGLAVGMVGVDPMSGRARLTFGVEELQDGVPVLALLLGLLVVGEVLHRVTRPQSPPPVAIAAQVTAPEAPVPDPPPPAEPATTAHRTTTSTFAPVPQDLLESKRPDLELREAEAPEPYDRGEAAGAPDPASANARVLWGRSWRSGLRGAAIGLPFGMLAAVTPEVPARLSALLERRLGRRSRGVAVERVAGPEAASAAAGTGLFVPVLLLGLFSGSLTASVMAGQTFSLLAFSGTGQSDRGAVEALPEILAGMLVASAMLLLLVLPLARALALARRIPPAVLYACAVTFAAFGGYLSTNDPAVMLLLAGFGILGALMRRADVPLAPAVIGYLLMRFTEEGVSRALMIGAGDPAVFVRTPVGVVLLAAGAAALLTPATMRHWRERRTQTTTEP